MRDKNPDYPFATLLLTLERSKAFEEFLQNDPSTAFMDYCLLKMNAHIHTLQNAEGKHNQNRDAASLPNVYMGLVDILIKYELEIAQLPTNPSRHQNKQRQTLVENFQQEWQKLMAPAQNKYQQTDTKNILKNVAAACTVLGLLWLAGKNLHRLTQGKGLSLFQFKTAYSRTKAHLQNLDQEFTKNISQVDLEHHNYFTRNIQDARLSHAALIGMKDEFQKELDDHCHDQTHDAAEVTLEELKTILKQFDRKLNQLDIDDPNTENTLLAAQISFMKSWQTMVTARQIVDKIKNHIFPEETTVFFEKILEISHQFDKDIKTLEHDLKTLTEEEPSRPNTPS